MNYDFNDFIMHIRRWYNLEDAIQWDEKLNFWVKWEETHIIYTAPITQENAHILYNLMYRNENVRYDFYYAARFIELTTGIAICEFRKGDSWHDEVLSTWRDDYTDPLELTQEFIDCWIHVDSELLKVTGEYGVTDDFVITRNDGDNTWFLANDVFYWGCADGEDFNVVDMPLFKESMSAVNKKWVGVMLYCCRRRKQRPQVAWYKSFSAQEKFLFNQCGPIETQYGSGCRNR